MSEFIEKAQSYLRGRRQSYLRIFNKESQDAKVILKDLAKFCRATESTFHKDPRIAAMLDGRREVWNRIQQHLNLRDEELWQIYGRKD
jgi:hypothetical protein